MPFKTAEKEVEYQRQYRQIHKLEKAEHDKQYYLYRKNGGVKLGHPQKATDTMLIDSYNRLGNIWLVCKEFGMCGQSVWERLARLKIIDKDKWDDNQLAILRTAYSVGKNEPINLNDLSRNIGKIKSNVCRKARELGLTCYNRTRTEEVKKHLSDMCQGSNAPNWQGGISFEPYTPEFNTRIKDFIRMRDNYTCRLCGIKQDLLPKKLSCHHIDYDKKNCHPTNLISLCVSCHTKTEHKRAYYTNFFTNLMTKEDRNER